MPRTKAIESGQRRGKPTDSVSSKKSQGTSLGSNAQEDEQKAEWSCRYDAKQGSYFFVDTATGEMTTTCPPEFEDEFHNMPQVQALKGVPRGFHRAALVIQSVLKFNRGRKPQFEKHLDTATGRYFFKNTFTHETTWDTPTGYYPLTRPPHATLEGLSLEKAMKQERKKKQSKQRRLLIQLRREEYHRGLKDREAKGVGAAQRAALEAWNEAFRLACLTGELKVLKRRVLPVGFSNALPWQRSNLLQSRSMLTGSLAHLTAVFFLYVFFVSRTASSIAIDLRSMIALSAATFSPRWRGRSWGTCTRTCPSFRSGLGSPCTRCGSWATTSVGCPPSSAAGGCAA